MGRCGQKDGRMKEVMEVKENRVVNKREAYCGSEGDKWRTSLHGIRMAAGWINQDTHDCRWP